MINETKQVFYVLKLDGKEVSNRFSDKVFAEVEKNKLEEADQKRVVVEQVTETGDSVLFG